MLLFDSHVHTESSEDAEHSSTYIAENAVERGLSGIAITDHCEIELFKERHYYHKVTQSLLHALITKGIFASRLKVLAGVEIGQPLVNLDYVRQVLDLARFDFILGSLHSVDGSIDFYFMDCTDPQYDIPALLASYYDELARMAVWGKGKIDSLAHITYPFRYVHGKYGMPYTDADYAGPIDEVLRLLVESGIALEINTSGLRQELGECLPNLAIVKRYRQMGGRLLTIGSDSHSAFNVGDGIREGVALAREAGFESYYYFENRVPVEVPLTDE